MRAFNVSLCEVHTPEINSAKSDWNPKSCKPLLDDPLKVQHEQVTVHGALPWRGVSVQTGHGATRDCVERRKDVLAANAFFLRKAVRLGICFLFHQGVRRRGSRELLSPLRNSALDGRIETGVWRTR